MVASVEPIRSRLRLYLDTADINAIADAKVDPTVVDQLHSTMVLVGCDLVVSIHHPWDYYPRSDQATKDRVIAALVRFPSVLFVDKDPVMFERPGSEQEDLVLATANVEELLSHPRAREAFDVLDPITSLVHEASHASQVAALETSKTSPLTKRDQQTFQQVFVSLLRGKNGTEADDLLRFWEERNGAPTTTEARQTLLGHLEPIAKMMRQLRAAFPDLDGDQLTALVRDQSDPNLAQTSPGRFFQRTLVEGRRRNLGRKSKRSDLVDTNHVQFLPYVDVFTTDRENVAVLQSGLARARMVRAACLIRNGNLAAVTDALRRLG